jgi:hypothetical protein
LSWYSPPPKALPIEISTNSTADLVAAEKKKKDLLKRLPKSYDDETKKVLSTWSAAEIETAYDEARKRLIERIVPTSVKVNMD